MPKGISDERKWKKAVDAFKKQYKHNPKEDEDYAIVNSIYQKMGGKFEKLQELFNSMKEFGPLAGPQRGSGSLPNDKDKLLKILDKLDKPGKNSRAIDRVLRNRKTLDELEKDEIEQLILDLQESLSGRLNRLSEGYNSEFKYKSKYVFIQKTGKMQYNARVMNKNDGGYGSGDEYSFTALSLNGAIDKIKKQIDRKESIGENKMTIKERLDKLREALTKLSFTDEETTQQASDILKRDNIKQLPNIKKSVILFNSEEDKEKAKKVLIGAGMKGIDKQSYVDKLNRLKELSTGDRVKVIRGPNRGERGIILEPTPNARNTWKVDFNDGGIDDVYEKDLQKESCRERLNNLRERKLTDIKFTAFDDNVKRLKQAIKAGDKIAAEGRAHTVKNDIDGIIAMIGYSERLNRISEAQDIKIQLTKPEISKLASAKSIYVGLKDGSRIEIKGVNVSPTEL